jgi:hypothetical protein
MISVKAVGTCRLSVLLCASTGNRIQEDAAIEENLARSVSSLRRKT